MNQARIDEARSIAAKIIHQVLSTEYNPAMQSYENRQAGKEQATADGAAAIIALIEASKCPVCAKEPQP